MSSDETERLVKMEEVLHSRVIGQEEAVTAISRAIRRARVGLKNPNRPIASFIFSGAPRPREACSSGMQPCLVRLRSSVPQRSVHRVMPRNVVVDQACLSQLLVFH